MAKGVIIAVIMLDFVLIIMTATWMLVNIYLGMSKLELWYSNLYVVTNIITLTLNLILIKRK